MALRNTFFHLFTAMIAVNLINADDVSDKVFGFPFSGNDNQTDSNKDLPFSSFFDLFQLPSFFNLGSLGSRQVRSTDDFEEETEDQQGKNIFGSIVSCNHTSQGWISCDGCRHSLACFPNNIGRLRLCRGVQKYCNNGRCSVIPGALCTNSTSG